MAELAIDTNNNSATESKLIAESLLLNAYLTYVGEFDGVLLVSYSETNGEPCIRLK